MSLVTQELRVAEPRPHDPRNQEQRKNDPQNSDPRKNDTVQALVQLLRGRSAEEIRQRMYDNPPGSNWWTACKTELDLRNGERMAHALVETARVLEKMRAATDHLDEMTEQAAQRTNEIAEIVQHVRDAGRRMEIATYIILGVAVLQLFYIAYQVSTKHP